MSYFLYLCVTIFVYMQDVMFLTQKNQELSVALSQAIHYEPSLSH